MASLDLLRLVAALAVVAFHYLFRGAAADGLLDTGYPAAAPFAIYGYLGVNLFFLISGFVIAWSAEGRNWADFAIARFARLYPGYVACMTATFLVLLMVGEPGLETNASTYAANILMFAPALHRPFMDGVYWSIVLEIIFYGWVALLILAGVFQRWKLWIIAGWLMIAAANEFVIGSEALRLVFLTQYASYFAAGILAQYMIAERRCPEALILLGAAFLLSCNTLTVMQDWMQAHYGVAISLGWLIIANALIYVVFGGAVLLRRLIAPSRTVLMLGGLTYPLYLLHQNIGYALLNAIVPHLGRWPGFAIVLAAMLTASYLVCRLIEAPVRKPLIDLLRGLADKFGGAVAKAPLAARA